MLYYYPHFLIRPHTFSNPIKNMFYNIIILQRFSRFFQKNFEKIV